MSDILLLGAGRGATFSPAQISGLQLWLDASAITGLSDADPVTTWEDESGNNNDAAQSTSSKKPTYRTNVLNGKPVVRFDGTDDALQTADISVVGAGGQWTAFAVVDYSSGTTTMIVDQDSVARVAQFLRYSSGAFQSIAFNTAGTAFTDGGGNHGSGFDILAAVRGETSVEAFLNGASGGATATTGTPQTGTENVAIGARSAGDANFFGGDVAEVLIYDSALSASDRARVEQYLANKYGLTLS